MTLFFFKDQGAAEAQCALLNRYSTGATFVVTDGPGDEETGEDNFAVMSLQEAVDSQFNYWVVYGDCSKSECYIPLEKSQ